jgi:transcriptional regulator with XRE-family HTH domain
MIFLSMQSTLSLYAAKGDAMTTLGREIKKARAALGWRQNRLQEATGISQKYLSRIENDHVDPSWSFVLKIAQALNMDLRVLYNDAGAAALPPVQRRRTRKAAPVS